MSDDLGVGGQESDGPGGDGEAWTRGYEWVTACSVDDFVGRLNAIRKGGSDGEPPRPANAIRALHAFAVMCPIDQLIDQRTSFDKRDAVHILATAALYRTPRQAAELAVKLWDAERGTGQLGSTSLTDGIIHDIAGQRTVLSVASFVREVHSRGRPMLAKKTVSNFSQASSGRTNLDRALLYIALRDGGSIADANDLLYQSLADEGEHDPAPESAPPAEEFDDLVGVLQHLSPAEQIVEGWVDERLKSADQVLETRRIVAQVIVGRSSPPGSLIEHVGKRLKQHDIAEICGRLIERKLPGRCAEIRRYAASRSHVDDLAEIIIAWHRSPTLTRTTSDLLADIVARGTESMAGPRSVRELGELSIQLGNNNADAECRRLLWIAAAEHIDHRSGAELVDLLHRVEQRLDRHRAARSIAQSLTICILENRADLGLFIEYIQELRKRSNANAAFLACKELADPSTSDWAGAKEGEIIAELAARLHDAALQRHSWNLLERCLENEQRRKPEDVAVIVARLRRSSMASDDRHFLVRATVGRWSDARRREEAVKDLRGNGFDTEAAEVIRSLR